MIKKTNQFALLSTEVDPIHCVITSQPKYSEHLNLVFYYLSIATEIPWSMILIIVIISTLSIKGWSIIRRCSPTSFFVNGLNLERSGGILKSWLYNAMENTLPEKIEIITWSISFSATGPHWTIYNSDQASSFVLLYVNTSPQHTLLSSSTNNCLTS